MMETLTDIMDLINNLDLSEEKKKELKAGFQKNTPQLLVRDSSGRSLLHHAVSNNLFEVAKDLLKLALEHHKLKRLINAVDKEGKTALHLAAIQGLDELILLLGYWGCNFNKSDLQKNTALHLAVINNRPSVVKNLLLVSKFTIKTQLRNLQGETPKDLVFKYKKNLQAQTALAKALTTPADLFGRTPLHLAVINNNSNQMELHLNAGASVNEADNDGMTALHFAAQCGLTHAHILLFLTYQEDINMNQVDKDGNTALHKSVEAQEPESVKILVSAKRPVNKDIKNHAGLTAENLTHFARNKKMVAALKEALSSVQVTNALSEEYKSKLFNHEELATNYLDYLKQFLDPLAPSLRNIVEQQKLPRFYSMSTYFKINRPRRDSEKSPLDLTPLQVKEENSESNSIKALFLKAYERQDPREIAIFITEFQKNRAFLRQNIKEFMSTFQDKRAAKLILSAFELLQTDKEFILEQEKIIKDSTIDFYLNLLGSGLKKFFPPQELNYLESSVLLQISDSKYLPILASLLNGKIVKTQQDVEIDLKFLVYQILGLMEFLEPHEIMQFLMKLNPLLSNIQQLQSHFIVFILIGLYNFYGYDKINSFKETLELYFDACENKKIVFPLQKFSILSFRNDSLTSLFIDVKPTLLPFLSKKKTVLLKKSMIS